jgi:AraC-like DNA-binding protein
MKSDVASRQEIVLAFPQRQNKLMLLTAGRLLYAGLLGRPGAREFGAVTVYVSLQNPFRIRVGDGEWQSRYAEVIQPDTPHQISSCDRLIGMLMIEPETVDIDKLPDFLQAGQDIESHPLVVERLRSGVRSLVHGQACADDLREHFDQFFFGHALPARPMDSRMAMVVARIQSQPCHGFKAETLASEIRLSVSRFLHLFREDVGTTFRQFRAWKRVRGFLAYVNTDLNLTDIAMATGYPSSSHFSYTVRRYWGLTPKDIVAGARHLAVVHDCGNPRYAEN